MSPFAHYDVAAYAVRRGLLPAVPAPTATLLVGGVSGVVVLVRGEQHAVVVKKALARLNVPGTWEAKPERALTEAAALAVLHPLTPEHTPELLDLDVDQLTFAMTAAPMDWVSWKDLLLSGACTDAQILDTARELGSILGNWHRSTWHDPSLAGTFSDYEALEQLRVGPFHRAVARCHPGVAPVVLACAEELLDSRDCLVHGDYSPKNVLVGDGLWVLDMEVAHVGAAVFDLAFMLCHLMLKALHLPARADVLHRAGEALLAGYRAHVPPASHGSSLALHTACLLLARVDGLSPAGYLRPGEVTAVRTVALDVLGSADPSLHQLWALVGEHAAQLDRTAQTAVRS